ncbi:Disabled isoform 2 [Schistosoma japonicum]|uniref:Disabled isoform 2 n=2 Tax=Schistosoma japonicum TaxID=6182 RepID=A0A4Z2DIH9_SCHJA|nr:Disabled isoform 2 [Schistosoma japonicum]
MVLTKQGNITEGDQKINHCDKDETEASLDTSKTKANEPKTNKLLENFVSQTYRAKFFGNISVSEPRGDFVCEKSLGILKAQLLTSKLHKKKVRIRVDTSGISVIGPRSATVHHMHKFENITFIWTDPCDLQSCGIIVKQTLIGDNVHQFYGYKLYQNTPKLIGVLKHIYSNLEIVPPNEDILSKSEHSSDTNIFDTNEENDSDLIQLVDVSESTIPSSQTNYDNGNVQKQYASNGHSVPHNKHQKNSENRWVTFDDPFENQGSSWVNSVSTDPLSQNFDNRLFGNNDQHFFPQINMGSQMFNNKQNPGPFEEVARCLPQNTISYLKSYSTTANTWSALPPGTQSTRTFPVDDYFSNGPLTPQIQSVPYNNNGTYANNKNVANNPFYNFSVRDTHLNMKQPSPLDTLFDLKLFN